jgi:hypothetical protein
MPCVYNVFFENSTPTGLWFLVDAFLVVNFDPFRVIICFKVDRFCIVVKEYLTAVFSFRCLYEQVFLIVFIFF